MKQFKNLELNKKLNERALEMSNLTYYVYNKDMKTIKLAITNSQNIRMTFLFIWE